MKLLDPSLHRDVVAALFSRAADYVILETGASPNRETVDEFFNERPPNVGSEDALHLGLFDGQHLHGIAGVTFGYPDPNDAYIGLLLLSQDMRGRGKGAVMLGHLTGLSRARGAQRQLIAVLDANPKGRAFWEREGFILEQTFPATNDAHIRHRMTRKI